jgi:hypothetical protein
MRSRKLIALATALALAALVPSARAQPGTAPNPDFLTACTQSVTYDASTNGATQLVASSGAARIYVCGFTFWAAGSVNVDLVYGTQTTNPCDTGTTKITPAFQFTTQTGIVDHLPVYQGLKPVPNGDQLCINTSAGTAVQAIVYFAQF